MTSVSLQSFDAAHLLDRALAFHQAGNLSSAQLFYGQILAVNRSHFDALHLLGVLRHQQGRAAEAHDLLAAAHRVDPYAIEVLLHLAIVLQDLGRNEEAVVSYDRILAIRPRDVDALNGRGCALWALGRPAAAVMSFDRAVVISPDHADAHRNRAGLMLDLGRCAEAAAGYDTAIALEPDHFDALCGRGRALADLTAFDAALASLDRAIMLRPEEALPRLERGRTLTALGRHVEALREYDQILVNAPNEAAALYGRGISLEQLGRLEDGETSYRAAVALRPDDATICDRLGVLLQQLKQFDEALALHDRALAFCPDDVDMLTNRGTALQGLGRHLEAIACHDRALSIRSDHTGALIHRGAAFNAIKMHAEALASVNKAVAHAPECGEAYYHRGRALGGQTRLVEALANYEHALACATPPPDAFGAYAECALRLCDWPRAAQIERELAAQLKARKSIVSPNVVLGYDTSPALQLACARHYVESSFARASHTLHGGGVNQHGKLRIAYLSANFNRHAMAHLMVNLFERHDRARFEVTGISFGADDTSDIRARVAAAFDRFLDVRDLTDRDIATLIAAHEIDIAVDIMGYTEDARPGILRHRPAPIQVSYLGYPGTMGADFIGYILADTVVVPPGEDDHYVEKVVRLPDSHHVHDARRPISAYAPTRREVGLPGRAFVFCAFNDNANISAAVFEVWMRLLTAVEGSVLWLLRGHQYADDNLRGAATARGVDPARLVFADHIEPEDHLERYRLADLFLDTLPRNAHAFASDALWAGLPVLTCRGNAFAGRIGASLLQAIGLPELITSSLADYAALAQWLARDPLLLREIRKRLAKNRTSHALFDADLSRRHIEMAYAAMWRIYRGGERPRSFRVESESDPGNARESNARESLAVAC